jgi:hypothetical protein
MLARIDRVLAAPKHSRENLIEFRRDQSLLADLHATRSAQLGAPPPVGSTSTP